MPPHARYLRSLIFCGIVALSLYACQSQDDATLRISRTYMVVPAGSAPSVLYAELTNHTNSLDTLVAISTPGARKAELHETFEVSSSHTDHGSETHQMSGTAIGPSMSMHAVPYLAIPPDSTVRFVPGGYHVMLFDPAPLRAGDSVAVSFQFAKLGTITTYARVITYADVDTATRR